MTKRRTKTKTATTDRLRAAGLGRGALLLAVWLIALALAAPSPASDRPLRDHYALIVATVWDSANRPVYGVHVQLRRSDGKKYTLDGYSNHSGEIAFRVPEGKADYILTADVKPSKGKTKPQVAAQVEKDERVEVSLHLTE